MLDRAHLEQKDAPSEAEELTVHERSLVASVRRPRERRLQRHIDRIMEGEQRTFVFLFAL